MAEIRKILKHSVWDVESGQLVAAFATESAAVRWCRDTKKLTEREYEVRPS